mmetsp:Transcript_6969/g.21867  ORF Transcript_6969/g.21867 Transcript_6969/m.21867 type:complete len:218 (-) Transcript_6969:138-791(-)
MRRRRRALCGPLRRRGAVTNLSRELLQRRRLRHALPLHRGSAASIGGRCQPRRVELPEADLSLSVPDHRDEAGLVGVDARIPRLGPRRSDQLIPSPVLHATALLALLLCHSSAATAAAAAAASRHVLLGAKIEDGSVVSEDGWRRRAEAWPTRRTREVSAACREPVCVARVGTRCPHAVKVGTRRRRPAQRSWSSLPLPARPPPELVERRAGVGELG